VLTSQGPVNQYGEVCAGDCDCCSGICEADANGVSRCKKGGDPTCGEPDQMQLPIGELCETDCQCASNICAEPRPPDAGGQFPKRCLDPATPGAGGQCKMEGQGCTDPADCCNALCLPALDFCGFACGGGGGGGGSSCVQEGNQCTNSGDCCGGLDCVPNGQGGLVCALLPPN
jgi:hypothetical protein